MRTCRDTTAPMRSNWFVAFVVEDGTPRKADGSAFHGRAMILSAERASRVEAREPSGHMNCCAFTTQPTSTSGVPRGLVPRTSPGARAPVGAAHRVPQCLRFFPEPREPAPKEVTHDI